MNETNPERDIVRIKASDLKPTSPEELARLDAITDERIERAVREDPDAPQLDESIFKGPRYEPRQIRIAEDLLPWLDKHPKRDSLINELLRAYRDERDTVADELEALAGRLRSQPGHKEAS